MKSPAMPGKVEPASKSQGSHAWMLCGAFALITLMTAFITSGASWPVVITQLLADGFLLIVWLVACFGLGSAVLRRKDAPHSAFVIVSAIAMGMGIISIAMFLLGLCGALNRVVAIAIIVLGAALAIWQLKNLKRESSRRVSRSSWMLLVLAPFLGIATVGALVPPGLLWGDEPNGYDVVEYHLQVPREWYEAGRISPLEHNVFSYFPFNVEMHYLLAMELEGGPWKGMYLAQLMHVAMIALGAAAVYGVVKELSGDSASACAGAVIAGATPWMSLLAPVAYNEGGLILFGTLGVGWFLRVSREDAKPQTALIAGMFAGFACGVKLTAVPVVVMAAPVAMLLSKWSGKNLRGAILFVVSAVVVFSPWLVRNVVWAHNPVFPEGMSVFGRAHFSDVQADRWTRAHSPTELQRSVGGRLTAFGKQVIIDPNFGWLLLPITIAAGVIGWHRAAIRALAILIVLHALFWIFFTHLQGRFFVLVVPWGAMLIALALAPRWRALSLTTAVVIGGMGLTVMILKVAVSQNRFGFFGLEDLSAVTPLANEKPSSDEPVVLIGDGGAFFYSLPMKQLHYRTVFDVNAKEGESLVDAWRAGAPATPGTIDIINPNELLRFSRTYWKILAPPADVTAHEQSYIIRH